MSNTLSFESTGELMLKKRELESKIAAHITPIYPPPGYRPNFALLNEYEIWLKEINKELAARRWEGKVG